MPPVVCGLGAHDPQLIWPAEWTAPASMTCRPMTAYKLDSSKLRESSTKLPLIGFLACSLLGVCCFIGTSAIYRLHRMQMRGTPEHHLKQIKPRIDIVKQHLNKKVWYHSTKIYFLRSLQIVWIHLALWRPKISIIFQLICDKIVWM